MPAIGVEDSVGMRWENEQIILGNVKFRMTGCSFRLSWIKGCKRVVVVVISGWYGIVGFNVPLYTL